MTGQETADHLANQIEEKIDLLKALQAELRSGRHITGTGQLSWWDVCPRLKRIAGYLISNADGLPAQCLDMPKH